MSPAELVGLTLSLYLDNYICMSLNISLVRDNFKLLVYLLKNGTVELVNFELRTTFYILTFV